MRAIFLLISAAVVAMAQSFDSNTNSSSDDTASTYFLCNGSISEANASGIVTHSWQDIKNTGYWSGAPDHSWAITVTGGNGQELERRFWYDTAGVNYADDVGIDTDVCAFPNFYLPLNANRLGQDDPGERLDLVPAAVAALQVRGGPGLGRLTKRDQGEDVVVHVRLADAGLIRR